MSEEKPRVLIVESSPGIQQLQKEIVRRTLQSDRIEIVSERKASAAVTHFSGSPFHLAMIDVSPAQSAEAVRELIHTSRVRQRCPTIAFTTGRIDRDTLKMLADDHCFAVFPKPFEPEDVATAIREAFEAQAASTDSVISPVLHGIIRLLHPTKQ